MHSIIGRSSKEIGVAEPRVLITDSLLFYISGSVDEVAKSQLQSVVFSLGPPESTKSVYRVCSKVIYMKVTIINTD